MRKFADGCVIDDCVVDDRVVDDRVVDDRVVDGFVFVNFCIYKHYKKQNMILNCKQYALLACMLIVFQPSGCVRVQCSSKYFTSFTNEVARSLGAYCKRLRQLSTYSYLESRA